MKHLFLTTALAGAALLAGGCSPDVAISAGTAATAAAQQAEQARIQKQIADQKIKAMQDSLQQHERSTNDIDEHLQHNDSEHGDRPAQ